MDRGGASMRIRAAAQDHGVAGLERQRTGVGGDVRAALEDDADDAERRAHALDVEAVRPVPFGDDRADRIGKRGDLLERVSRSPATRSGSSCRGRWQRVRAARRCIAATSLLVRREEPRRRAGGAPAAAARSAAFFASVEALASSAAAARARAPMPSISACTSGASPAANSLRFAFIRFLNDRTDRSIAAKGL